MKYSTVVGSVVVGDQSYISVEMPENLLEEMKLVPGEVLEWQVSDDKDSISISRTRVIVNGHQPD